MNIYQHEETGRIFEGYGAPQGYLQIGSYCDKCNGHNEIWQWSGWCGPCRAKYLERLAKKYETRPIGA